MVGMPMSAATPSRFDVSIGLSRAGVEVSLGERWLSPGVRLVELHGALPRPPKKFRSDALDTLLQVQPLEVGRAVFTLEQGAFELALDKLVGDIAFPLKSGASWRVERVRVLDQLPALLGTDAPMCIELRGHQTGGIPVGVWLSAEVEIAGRHLVLGLAPRAILGLTTQDTHGLVDRLGHCLAERAFVHYGEGRLRVDIGRRLLARAWLEMGWRVPDLGQLVLWSLQVGGGQFDVELRAATAPQPDADTSTTRRPRATRRHIETARSMVAPPATSAKVRRAAVRRWGVGIGVSRPLEQLSKPQDPPVDVGEVDVSHGDRRLAAAATRYRCATSLDRDNRARESLLTDACTNFPGDDLARRLLLAAVAKRPLAHRVALLQRSQQLPGNRDTQRLRGVAWGLSLLVHSGDAKASRRVLEPIAHAELRDPGAPQVGLRIWCAVTRARAEDEDVVCESVLDAISHAHTCFSRLPHRDAAPLWQTTAVDSMVARYAARKLEDAIRLAERMLPKSDAHPPADWLVTLAHAPRTLLADMTQGLRASPELCMFFAYAWKMALEQVDATTAAHYHEQVQCLATIRTTLGERVSPKDVVEEAWLLGFALGQVGRAIELLQAANRRWPADRAIEQAIADLEETVTNTPA